MNIAVLGAGAWGTALAIAFAANLLTFFLFYEVLTLVTYPLVTHAGTDKAKQAGRVYLGILMGTSVLFLLPAVIYTAFVSGTTDFRPGGILPADLSPATVTVLLALFTAIATAYVLARRLSAPLSILAEGTQAVAAGDFTPRQAIYSGDELGVLTQSFNRMTRQLDDARRDTERHRVEVESARAYLESILANLSAGVLVFDRRFMLRTVNAGAQAILEDDFTGLVGEMVDAWPREQVFGQAIRDAFAEYGDKEWQTQIQLEEPGGPPKMLLLRGTQLPEGSHGGYVVVFDDVTSLVAAQRSAAWGEVARRLAHEIKNPLTPIQLSAERMQMKFADKLAGADAEMLDRSTQTIINQVQAMKRMVNEFSDYARMPAPELAALDLNGLIREVLGLYETSQVSIRVALASDLPEVWGDATQLRQIIHNLLRNAEEAQEVFAHLPLDAPHFFVTAPEVEEPELVALLFDFIDLVVDAQDERPFTKAEGLHLAVLAVLVVFNGLGNKVIFVEVERFQAIVEGEINP